MWQLMNHRQTKCLSILVWRVQGPDRADKSYMTLGLACRRQPPARLSADFILYCRLRPQVTLAKKSGLIHGHVWFNCWARAAQNQTLFYSKSRNLHFIPAEEVEQRQTFLGIGSVERVQKPNESELEASLKTQYKSI